MNYKKYFMYIGLLLLVGLGFFIFHTLIKKNKTTVSSPRPQGLYYLHNMFLSDTSTPPTFRINNLDGTAYGTFILPEWGSDSALIAIFSWGVRPDAEPRLLGLFKYSDKGIFEKSSINFRNVRYDFENFSVFLGDISILFKKEDFITIDSKDVNKLRSLPGFQNAKIINQDN